MPRRGWRCLCRHPRSSSSGRAIPRTATWRRTSRSRSPRRSSRSPGPSPSGWSRPCSCRRVWSVGSRSRAPGSSTSFSPKRGRPVALPEGGYHGEYIRDIAEHYVAAHPNDPEGADLDAVRRFAVQELRKEQDADLHAFGVTFDVYFLESSLYATSKVEETM